MVRLAPAIATYTSATILRTCSHARQNVNV